MGPRSQQHHQIWIQTAALFRALSRLPPSRQLRAVRPCPCVPLPTRSSFARCRGRPVRPSLEKAASHVALVPPPCCLPPSFLPSPPLRSASAATASHTLTLPRPLSALGPVRVAAGRGGNGGGREWRRRGHQGGLRADLQDAQGGAAHRPGLRVHRGVTPVDRPRNDPSLSLSLAVAAVLPSFFCSCFLA